MTREQIFGNAVWVGKKEDKFQFLRGKFNVQDAQKATLRVLGLGYFHCYINGQRVGNDLFLPLNTDYELREKYPDAEVLNGHRIYVPEYEITPLLQNGENVIVIHFGGGPYTGIGEWWGCTEGVGTFGSVKAIWRIFGEDANGTFDFVSSENDRLSKSYIEDYYIIIHEVQDLTKSEQGVLELDFDDSAWKNATLAKPVESEYLFSDCPPDRVCELLPTKEIKRENGYTVYDCGKNISGYPVLKLMGKKGETVKVVFSEERTSDGDIDPRYCHKQQFLVIGDGTERDVRPLFTWFGFRYFAVHGNAEVAYVEDVHTDVKVTSSFHSDNETLNWLNESFLNTQLSNMHAGIPLDCPHLERRGYTGDGQLVCHAAMNTLDAKAFYRKWIGDILDCQDQKSGHIQYTAPYVLAGGGPGGWGCAIVEVPYQYYLHYGDASVLSECYPAMLRYFDFLEAHSEGDLVVSTQKGLWCLGDWCSPEDVALPAPFVNNYFYVKSLLACVKIAKLIGREDNVPMLEKRIAARRNATQNAYFNTWDGNFFGGVQGANAFAVDMGIGDERTYKKLVAYYQKLGCFDTGIFGTDIVTRVLFEHGDGQLAADLLLSEKTHSYAEKKRRGATTFWEYWPDSVHERSHNHPMFGAVTAYLYDYLLGIRQESDSAGYQKLLISPILIDQIKRLQGKRTLPMGEVIVSYEKKRESIAFSITLPEQTKALFLLEKDVRILTAGENRFEIPMERRT